MIFKSTPTRNDENFKGWSNRIIYLFAKNKGVDVNVNDNVFDIIGEEDNKGSFLFPANFFQKIEDGYTLKITMYFDNMVDNNTILIGTGIKSGSNEYKIYTKESNDHLCKPTGEKKLFRYETIITKIFDASSSETFLSIVGNVTYNDTAIASTQDAGVNFISIKGNLTIDPTGNYKLFIANKGSLPMKVNTLIIEEIN